MEEPHPRHHPSSSIKKIKRVNREKTQRIQERLWVNPGFFLDEQGWLEFITATCSSH